MDETYKALVLEKGEKAPNVVFKQISRADLPDGDVLVQVSHSSLNYKDGLAVTGAGRVIRDFPMVPGIDFAGTVVESSSPRWKAGNAVVLTGWGVGERWWGGYAGLARLKSEWLVALPDGLSPLHAMSIGTAGLTSMLCVLALEDHGATPDGKPVVVTGAAGGVGSVAVALLATAGYSVTASTGRETETSFLKELGASNVIGRFAASEKPLEPERWGGAVDTVGGQTLAAVLRTLSYGSAAAACGLAGGADLPTSVIPFILRNVALLGVDSVQCPTPRREIAWTRLARDLSPDLLDRLTTVVSLDEVPRLAGEILQGQVRGRVVVDVTR